MTSLSPEMYNVALLIVLIVVALWLLSTAYRAYSLHSLSAAYSRHELLHVEGITRYSNLTRDHLLSILRARSSHTAHLAPRYAIAAHIEAQRGCKVRMEGGDDGAGEVGLHVRVSCTRVSRLDVFVGVPQLAVAQLYQQEKNETTVTKERTKSRFRFNKADATRPSVGPLKANQLRLPSPSLVSPSPPPSELALSPSPFGNSPPTSHRSVSTMPGPVSISTLGSLQVREAGGWRGGGGGRGMVASASNSFLPVLEQAEEKKEAEASVKDSERSDKAVLEDSVALHAGAADGSPGRPAARPLLLTAEAEEDNEPLVKGWTARDLTILMRNRSAVDDDVHALHDDDYMYRLPPAVLPPCTDKDISVVVPREWLVRLHQRLESMGLEGESELYPIILQVRPIDTDALPSNQTNGSPEAAERRLELEQKQKASSWDDATVTKGGGGPSDGETKKEDMLVTELTLLEFQSAKRDAGATSPISPRSPRRMLSFPSRPSSPSTSRPMSPSIHSASSTTSSPVASFEEYLRHIRLCRQLVIPPTGSVYCVEELFGVDSSSSSDCLVCLTERKDVLLLPCRHVAICGTCHKSVTRCPVCRSSILSYMRWVDEEQVWRELGVAGSSDATKKSSPHPGLLPEVQAAAMRLKGDGEQGAVEMAALSPMSGHTAGGEGGGERRPIERDSEEGKDGADTLQSATAHYPVLMSAEARTGESGAARAKAGLSLADVEMADMSDGTLAAPNSPAQHAYQ